jgi:CrcB protein
MFGSERGGALVRSRWDVLLAIGAGGALGSLARYGIGELASWPGRGFPWATFVENVSGSLALGGLVVLLLEVWPPHRHLRPFLGVGLLGGYTTFSTYMLETRELLAGGQPAVAFGYLSGTLVAGIVAVWLGILAVRLAVRSRPGRRRESKARTPGDHADEIRRNA